MHIIVHNYAMLCTFVHTRCIICEPHMYIILCRLCKFHNSFQIQIEAGIKSFSAVSLASWFCVNMGWHAWIRLFHQWIINKCVGCVSVGGTVSEKSTIICSYATASPRSHLAHICNQRSYIQWLPLAHIWQEKLEIELCTHLQENTFVLFSFRCERTNNDAKLPP